MRERLRELVCVLLGHRWEYYRAGSNLQYVATGDPDGEYRHCSRCYRTELDL